MKVKVLPDNFQKHITQLPAFLFYFVEQVTTIDNSHIGTPLFLA